MTSPLGKARVIIKVPLPMSDRPLEASAPNRAITEASMEHFPEIAKRPALILTFNREKKTRKQ